MMTVDEIKQALAAPFAADDVHFKPAVVSGNRAMAIGYIDARNVEDRLDDVLGIENWQDDYQSIGDNGVICRLKIRLNGEWITKVDVGGESEQSDGGDRVKAALSDALKRAAVKFGIGRYLYRLPKQWCDYDVQKKQFVRPPQLPSWALPGGEKRTAAPVKTASPPQPASHPVAKANGSPPTKERMMQLIEWQDGELVKQAGTRPGEFKTEVLRLCDEYGYGVPSEWTNTLHVCEVCKDAKERFLAAAAAGI